MISVFFYIIDNSYIIYKYDIKNLKKNYVSHNFNHLTINNDDK